MHRPNNLCVFVLFNATCSLTWQKNIGLSLVYLFYTGNPSYECVVYRMCFFTVLGKYDCISLVIVFMSFLFCVLVM